MNAYGILGALVIMAALGSWGTFESGRVDKLQGQIDSLKASYNTAAANAKADALIQEEKDKAILANQSSQAISQAQQATLQAQNQLKTYQAKLKADAGMKDLGHVCSGVAIPRDLVP